MRRTHIHVVAGLVCFVLALAGVAQAQSPTDNVQATPEYQGQAPPADTTPGDQSTPPVDQSTPPGDQSTPPDDGAEVPPDDGDEGEQPPDEGSPPEDSDCHGCDATVATPRFTG